MTKPDRATRFPHRRLPGLVLCCLALGGCAAVGPDFARPSAPKTASYTHAPLPAQTAAAPGHGGAAQRFDPDAPIAADWWRVFASDKLDGIVRAALARNPSLQSAESRLRQAQETLSAAYGVIYPNVDANLGATHQKFSSVRFGGSPGSRIFTVYAGGINVTYSLDLFGRARRALEGQIAQVDYQRYELQAARLALLGNVVNTAIAGAGYRAQIEANQQLAALERRLLQITEAQVRAGTVPAANALSARAQLAATEAAIPPLAQRVSQSEHLLALLQGQAPGDGSVPAITLRDLTLPQRLPVSLPSQLVRQRPDILAAEAQLHAASANIGVATAALYPDFSLSASYGQNSLTLGSFFDSINNLWSLGANLTAPIFHGGTLRAQRRVAVEAYHGALASYRQTVLGAFAQVADVLRALEHDAEALAAQQRAMQASQRNLDIMQASYKAGASNYLAVLIAERQYQQARLGYVQSLTQRYQDSATLYSALGGGWWHAEETHGPAPSATR